METIDRQQLKKWMDEKRDFVLIEALPEENFRKEHLPGAINIPVKDERFEDKIRESVPDTEKPVVVYCANTDCPASPEAGRKMEAMGYSKVFDYEAGKEDWKQAELELERRAA